MAQKSRRRKGTARLSHTRTRERAASATAAPRRRLLSPGALFEGLIHARTPDQPSWRLAPLVLALIVFPIVQRTMPQIDAGFPAPPANAGIRFAGQAAAQRRR